MARQSNFVNTEWTPELAYVVGLFASDGNLSPDGRHLSFCSKDKDLPVIIKKILKLHNTIGRKARGGSKKKLYYVFQFGSRQFYNFLLSIGLTPHKSKTIAALKVPDEYFADFLRGCFDGDGSITKTMHPESKHAQLRFSIYSASPKFLSWLLAKHKQLWHIEGGWIYMDKKKLVGSLCYGKRDATQILKHIYQNKNSFCLKRKQITAAKYLGE